MVPDSDDPSGRCSPIPEWVIATDFHPIIKYRPLKAPRLSHFGSEIAPKFRLLAEGRNARIDNSLQVGVKRQPFIASFQSIWKPYPTSDFREPDADRSRTAEQHIMQMQRLSPK